MQILPVAAPAGLPALADLPAALPVVNLYFRPPILPAPAIAYCRLPLLPDQKAVAGCHYCRNTTGKTALCPAMAIIAGHCCSTHIRDRQSKSRQYAKYPATAYIFPYVSGTVYRPLASTRSTHNRMEEEMMCALRATPALARRAL